MNAKNVVLCCDGTANQIASDHTNVAKLFGVLEKSDRQVAYYHAGLGTMEAAGALTPITRVISRLWGLAFGLGISGDVCDAYAFLTKHYEPGDRVYLFGFSRGAYTVRVLASLLHACGLLTVGGEALTPYLLRMLTSISNAANRNGESDSARLFETIQWARAHVARSECPVYFCGVWDTVSSVGWYENPMRVPYSASNPSIQIGRHAIAIDERRAFFRTNLWHLGADPAKPTGPHDLKQVWFAGVHSDVGGGYPEAESGLAKIALDWMLREAGGAGLFTVRAEVDKVMGGAPPYVPPSPNAKMHESLQGAWRLAEFIPKRHWDWAQQRETHRMNLFRRRTIPEGAVIHQSVFSRSGYKPSLPTVYSVES